MRLSSILSREKTRPSVKTTTTFNAPGNYLPPYGKTTVRISGRGATGSPSAFSYTNPTNYAIVPGSYYYNNSGSDVYMNVSYYHETNGNYTTTQTLWDQNNNWSYGLTIYSYAPRIEQTLSFISSAPHITGGPYQSYTAVPGNDVYTTGPTGPSSNILGVTFPGGAGGPGGNYPDYPANTEWVASGSLAPVVPTTTTTISYTGSPISITVPSGGYITIDNV